MTDEPRAALAYIQKENLGEISNTADDDHMQELFTQMRQYEIYRENYATNIVFDPSNINLSKLSSDVELVRN